MANLPIIDFANFSTGGERSRFALARRIGAACENIGFMYVANHGVAQRTIDAALDTTRRFFAEPTERKRVLERRPGTYRGYIPMRPFSEDRESGQAYLYEAFIVGPELEAGSPARESLRWPNLWPLDSTWLREAITAYYAAVTAFSNRLLQAFALALGQREDALLAHFEQPMTNISLLHYPARAGDGLHDAANARPHYDTNALTILVPGESGGLEVEHRTLGWTEVPPRPGCLVVNIGNMMECWSAGRFRSTMHRVHPPLDSERFSIAYFASPDYDTVVEPLAGPATGDGNRGRSRLHAGEAFASFVAGFDRSDE